MTEIKLEKRFPHISDEDVTRIFQDGYMKGWEDARKKAIPIEWIVNWLNKSNRHYCDTDQMLLDWEKENGK